MKKIALLFVVLLLATGTFAQGVLNLFKKSEDFIVLLASEKYMDAHAYFDASVSDRITPDALLKMWTSMVTKNGPLETVDVFKSNAEGEYYSILMETKFEKEQEVLRFVFNKAEKLVGLFLMPKSNVETYKKAAYADSTLYKETEIHVNTPGHQLVGKLTTPRTGTNFPVVVLVHGSGPGDMDQSVGANKPFKDLAVGLAAKGIATIRYVKRTLVYSGEFASKPFTVKEEVLDDALAAIALAKATPGLNKGKIFLLGHSLGGMLAPRMATMTPDLSGIILAAAPARTLTELIIDQNKYMFSLGKDTTAAMKQNLANAITEIGKTGLTELGSLSADSLILGLPAAYWIDLNTHNQINTAKGLTKQRIMVVQGGNDYQVTNIDFDLWKASLSGKKNVTFKFYPELNHLLSPQKEKGTSKQYATHTSVSPTLINDIAAWIKQ